MWKKVSATIAAFLLFLGFLADFPVAKKALEDNVDALVPVLSALLPWLALGGALFTGLMLLGWTYLAFVEWQRRPPRRVTQFKALSVEAHNCFAELDSYSRRLQWATVSQDRSETLSRHAQVVARLGRLFAFLGTFELPVPTNWHLRDQHDRTMLLEYLAELKAGASFGTEETTKEALQGVLEKSNR